MIDPLPLQPVIVAVILFWFKSLLFKHGSVLGVAHTLQISYYLYRGLLWFLFGNYCACNN
jgi:hypothetical protein